MTLSSDFPYFVPPYTVVTDSTQTYYSGKSWEDLDSSSTYSVTWPTANDTSYWNSLFTNYYKITSDDYNANSEYYQQFFGEIWTNYYIYYSGNTTNIYNNTNWENYLSSQDVLDQIVNVFIYAVDFFNDAILDIQNSMLYQTQRTTAFNYASSDAISAMSAALANSVSVTSSGDFSGTSNNAEQNEYISIYQSYSSQSSSYLGQGITNVGSFNDAASNNQTLIDNFLKELNSIISTLFQ